MPVEQVVLRKDNGKAACTTPTRDAREQPCEKVVEGLCGARAHTQQHTQQTLGMSDRVSAARATARGAADSRHAVDTTWPTDRVGECAREVITPQLTLALWANLLQLKWLG